MQNYNYYFPPLANYIDDQRTLLYNASLPNNNSQIQQQTTSTMENSSHPAGPQSSSSNSSKGILHKVLRETPVKREERLSRNAERMRERRNMESSEERRKRLDKNALSNRVRRLNESNDQKVLRQARNAARQRLRRAMETQDERDKRLKKLSERMREVRSKDDVSSSLPYTPRRCKNEAKKQSSYSEDDSFETSVSVESNPLTSNNHPANNNHNNILPNSTHFFGGNASIDSNSLSINSNHPMFYYNSHNLPPTQIFANNHDEHQKSFFSSLKLSPVYNSSSVSQPSHQLQSQEQQQHHHHQHNNLPQQQQLVVNMENELSNSQMKVRRESPEARERRLIRNAERMRERRAIESIEERRERLDKNALNNRLRRLRESPTDKVNRQVRDATRQRVRRSMESEEERDDRLKKLADKMRDVRKSETPELKFMATVKAREKTQQQQQQEHYDGSARKIRENRNRNGSSEYFSQFQVNAAYISDTCTLNIPQYHSIFQSSPSGLYKHDLEPQISLNSNSHNRIPQLQQTPISSQSIIVNSSNNKCSQILKKSAAPPSHSQRGAKKPKEGSDQLFSNFSEAQTTALILEPIIEMST